MHSSNKKRPPGVRGGDPGAVCMPAGNWGISTDEGSLTQPRHRVLLLRANVLCSGAIALLFLVMPHRSVWK